MTSIRSSPRPEVHSQLKRPKVSFNLDKTMAKEKDPLPIVELKPFIPKVWRREKSLPGFYDKSDAGARAGSRNTKETSETVPISEVTEDIQTSMTPQSTSHTTSPPSPRLVHFYINAFSDFKSQKEHFNTFVGESGFRPKSRIHPPADVVQKKQREHSQCLIPGFITRDDRTKSTLTEITDGESLSKSYSCLPKALAPEDIKKQQEIRITGAKYTQETGRKQQLQYLRPFKGVYVNPGWHGLGIRHGSPASSLYQSKSSVNSSKSEARTSRVKSPFYDHLDRKGALPSLTINAHSLRSRNSNPQDDKHSDDYQDYMESYEKNTREHKVGGIKNSLKFLSKHGTPTKVERQLTFELEINLSRFRKSRDYFPFEVTPSELAKYYPVNNHNMTPGETLIRKGLQSNASRSRRSITSRGTISSTLKSATSGEQSLVQGKLKKRMESGLSFERERELDFQITPRTDKEVESRVDEYVPMDTPRSPVNSAKDTRTSFAPGTKSSVSTESVKGPVAKQPDENKMSSDNHIPDNNKMAAGREVGADGRTFITSDNLIQVTG